MKTARDLCQQALLPPQTIAGILQGSWAIRTLKTACEIGLFDQLKEGPRGAEAVADSLSVPVAGIALMLDALVGLKLLDRADLENSAHAGPIAKSEAKSTAGSGGNHNQLRGSLAYATYALNEESSVYLLQDSPLYLGLYLKQHDELDKMWRGLKETIISGKPVMEVNEDSKAEEIFPRLAESIFPLNYAIACDVVRYLKTKRDYFCEPLYVLDLACGGAPWSVPFAQQKAYTKVDALDFPAVLSLTRKMVDIYGVGQQFRFLPGNWRDVEISEGRYDVVILGHILHSEGFELSRQLLAKCYKALQPGGALLIAEFLTNREHTGPSQPLMFGLNMYLGTTDGCVFSLEQLKQLCTEVGFAEIIRHSGIGYDSPVLLAFK